MLYYYYYYYFYYTVIIIITLLLYCNLLLLLLLFIFTYYYYYYYLLFNLTYQLLYTFKSFLTHKNFTIITIIICYQFNLPITMYIQISLNS